MLTLDDDLKTTLRGIFQAGAKGFRGRCDIKYFIPGSVILGGTVDFNLLHGTITNDPGNYDLSPYPPGQADWTQIAHVNDGNNSTLAYLPYNYIEWRSVLRTDLGAPYDVTTVYVSSSLGLLNVLDYSTDGTTWTAVPGTWVDDSGGGPTPYSAAHLTITGGPISARYWRIGAADTRLHALEDMNSWKLVGVAGDVVDNSLGTVSYPLISIGLDKSRRMVASEADVVIDIGNGDIPVSVGGNLQTTAQIETYQWYGDVANAVRTFKGLIDLIHEDRGPDSRILRITARDRMKWLIDDSFVATAPQNADEDGAVRTPANGVYLNYDVDDIVIDILNRLGWPAADRNIAPTSFAVAEYILTDGTSWADNIIGENRLTDLVGYDAWADENGIFQFQPAAGNLSADSDTDPVPVYSYIVGDTGSDLDINPTVLTLAHEIDDDDLKTRVRIRGQLPGSTPAWTQVWASSKLTLPVGVMYVPADSSHIYVLDRGTKKIYRLKESDGTRSDSGIWPLYIGGSVTHPIGLSRDPADSDRFWVLEAQYWTTGSITGNKIHKFDLSDGSHLTNYSIADGKWTAIKVSAANIWLTNWSTDKVHKHSKTDGSSVASYTVTYGGVAQINPTGIFVDGTTLGIFFYGKARFLLVDESDPTTIDTTNALLVTSGVISTAGTKILGGEMNTDSHAVLYADSDALHLTWKFNLTTPTTADVSVEVANQALEDELGFLSGLADREHDLHPGDADHAFEIRRETIEIQKLLTNQAQAYDMAIRNLALLSHRREVLDLGIIGNPGHQKNDLIQVTNAVSGIDTLWILDTYQNDMEDSSYVGVISLLPYDPTY